MRKIFTFSLERDRKLVIRLQIAALLLLVPFGYLFYFPVAGRFSSPLKILLSPVGLPARIFDWVIIIGTVILALLLHELIHGLLFKLFAPRHNRISFGFSSGFAYAAAPNILYPRVPYIIIGMGPLLLISFLAVILLITLPQQAAAPVFAASLFNSAGSAGDMYITYLVIKAPPGTLIRDKGTEFTAYH